MAVRPQGKTTLLADLPAEAAAAIAAGLSGHIMTETQVMAGTPDPDRRDEILTRIQNWNQQRTYITQKAWHQPADAVVTLRFGAPCWKQILSALETAELQHGAELVAETVAALQTAVLKRDGMLGEDDTIVLPDMP